MTEIQTALAFLERLAARGHQLRAQLDSGPADPAVLDTVRAWQRDCAGAINELSGGSKAHWLSKAFSAAFLVATPRRGDQALVVEAPPTEILDRLLAVVAQARASLTQMAAGTAPAVSTGPSAPRRFEFVRDASIRPVLEQAFVDGERALEAGDAEAAFMTFCSLLEAIITDALNRPGGRDATALSFDERIAAAESAGLIHAGCGRLPPSARRYRERDGTSGEAAIRDATVVRQVLRVVMRDLDPGR
ncbi:MAG TPA: hypothetical protein VEU08_22340 [Vicinamibacterales bacterium]|nr:hypothetical protein [Vicinamibacterales bacterium]